MKIKTTRDKKTHEAHLTVKLTKGEELDYAKAELLKTIQDVSFLPFTYTTEKDGSTLLSYDISGTIALELYLGADLSLAQFRALLTELAYAVELCTSKGFSYTELLFDSDNVYVNAECNHLQLAFVPASIPASKRASINDLLRFIAQKTKFVRAEDKPCSEALLDFIKRQTIFSLVDFRSFLDSGELKRSTGEAVSALDTSDFINPDTGKPDSIRLNQSAADSGTLRNAPAASNAGAYDFVKAQAGAQSAQEIRASKNLAEQISFDVADVAATPTGTTGAANWDAVAAQSAPLNRSQASSQESAGEESAPAAPQGEPVEGVAGPPPTGAAVQGIDAPPSGAANQNTIAPPPMGAPVQGVMTPPPAGERVQSSTTPPPAGEPVQSVVTSPVDGSAQGDITPLPIGDPVPIAPQPSAAEEAVPLAPPVIPQGDPIQIPPPAPIEESVISLDASIAPQSFTIVRLATGERYSLQHGRSTSIGRSKRCDIRIANNTNISRVHALLEITNEGCLVTDQGATNKTFLGGSELSPHTPQLAAPGDEIKLADECLRLEAK